MVRKLSELVPATPNIDMIGIVKEPQLVQTPSTLTSMLKELQKEDIISREAFNEIPPRVEYALTKRGKELRTAIIPLLKWATKKGNFKMHCNCSLLK